MEDAHAPTEATVAGVAGSSEGADPADAAAARTGSSSAPNGGVWEAAALIGDQGLEQLTDLENRRKRLYAEREALQKDIRNAERKRLRLIEKARGLSDTDLLDIMATRAAAKAKAHAKAKAKAKAAA